MNMGKYTVGQKVRVREDLVVMKEYKNNVGTVCTLYNHSMDSYRGEALTIAEKNSYGYRMDGNPWTWTDVMLKPEKPEKPVEQLMPSAVLRLESISKMEIFVDKVIVNDPATILFYRVANYDNDGRFLHWGNELKKIVAKCNKDIGDKFDVGKGVEVATLKAYRKEIDKLLRKV